MENQQHLVSPIYIIQRFAEIPKQYTALAVDSLAPYLDQ